MKPFDLEAAKRGEPICTRDGRKAWFASYVPSDLNIETAYPLAVWAEGYNHVISATADGHTFVDRSISNDDLFMAPKKGHGYLIVWRDGSHLRVAITKSEAACNDYCDCLRSEGYTILTYGEKIEWVE